MNIFFKHTETRPMGHSSLIDDLAWCGHNERISNLERYKDNMKDVMTRVKSLKQANKQAIRYYDWLIKSVTQEYSDVPINPYLEY